MTAIIDEMWDVLSQVSDEVGEANLGPSGEYIVKYEGWSPNCIPSRYKSGEAMIGYGTRRSSGIHKEWKKEMESRGYSLVEVGHEAPQGLYGVTYGL